MAGFYPDVPDQRLAWDRDGTVLLRWVGASDEEGTETQRQQMNDESTAAPFSAIGSGNVILYVLMFPQPMDLTAFFLLVANGNQACVIEVSDDTTNGSDGTWTTLIASHGPESTTAVNDRYRDSITTLVGADAVTAFRTRHTTSGSSSARWSQIRNLHLYGTPTSPPDTLQLWHPTLDERLAPAALDWGDVPRDTQEVREFRVKNVSSTFNAGDVVVSVEALTPGSPTIVDQMTVSDDGTTFGASVTIPTLAAGATSSVLYLRRNIDPAASLGVFAARVIAEPTTWAE